LFDEFYKGFKSKAGLNVVYYPSWHETHDFNTTCETSLKTSGMRCVSSAGPRP
jgi:hypothetical protein